MTNPMPAQTKRTPPTTSQIIVFSDFILSFPMLLSFSPVFDVVFVFSSMSPGVFSLSSSMPSSMHPTSCCSYLPTALKKNMV